MIDGRWRSGEQGATLVEFAMVGALFLFTIMGMMTLALYVFEVQAANRAVQAAARWAVAGVNMKQLTGAQGNTLVPECGPNGPLPGVAPSGMLNSAQAAAGPFAPSITSTTLETAVPNTAYTNEGPGCVVTVTLPYRAFGLPFGLSLGNVTATATDYVT